MLSRLDDQNIVYGLRSTCKECPLAYIHDVRAHHTALHILK